MKHPWWKWRRRHFMLPELTRQEDGRFAASYRVVSVMDFIAATAKQGWSVQKLLFVVRKRRRRSRRVGGR